MSERDRSEGALEPVPPGVESLRCSFCGKPRNEVRSLICGPTPEVAICDECVDLCAGIMREQLAGPPPDDHPAAA